MLDTQAKNKVFLKGQELKALIFHRKIKDLNEEVAIAMASHIYYEQVDILK